MKTRSRIRGYNWGQLFFVKVCSKMSFQRMTSEMFHHKRQLLTELIGRAAEFTLPAGTDGELSFDFGGVQWVVLCNQEWLEHSSIHKERHAGDLDVQHVVMPLFVTCL